MKDEIIRSSSSILCVVECSADCHWPADDLVRKTKTPRRCNAERLGLLKGIQLGPAAVKLVRPPILMTTFVVPFDSAAQVPRDRQSAIIQGERGMTATTG